MNKKMKEPGANLYPVPAVMVSCADETGKKNIITIAWTGVLASDPPAVGVGVRPNRYSYDLIDKSREFVINLPDNETFAALDYCGVVSGRDVDKFAATQLTPAEPDVLEYAPLIKECPINLECEVIKCVSLQSHDYFVGQVKRTHVASKWVGDRDEILPNPEEMISYARGTYYNLGQAMGKSGFAVRENIFSDDG